ncbi:MAG: hypothetical protein ACLQFR_07560 [Streptosporangiaceae bacterium]
MADFAPADCTLPNAERPLRAAEFMDLFDGAVMSAERLDDSRQQLRLQRDGQIASRAAALATAETGCCSFFVFALTVTSDSLLLDITQSDAGNAPVVHEITPVSRWRMSWQRQVTSG